MTDQRPYSYAVLRYVHDPLAAEFVNVGVIVFVPGRVSQAAYLRAETRKTIGRMRDMFPDLDRTSFLSAMRAIDRGLSRLSKTVMQQGLLPTEGDALSIAHQALPKNDTSLQWSPVGSGLCKNPDSIFERLYERYVSKYDQRQARRRSDDEVWRPVRAKLEERRISIDLQPKVIRSGDDQVEFQHAWKNGAWHVYEPLSLDLADADGIAQKAHRWLGQLTSIAIDATERFQPHFIVGAPTNPQLEPAYQRALRILQKAPIDVEIFEESQVDLLVDRIEDEMKAHLTAE